MSSLAELEGNLAESLTQLREDWPHMLEPTSSGSVAAAPSAAPTQLDDDSTSEVDIPRLERVLSLRRELVDYLAGLALVVHQQRPAAATVRCRHGSVVVHTSFTLRWPEVGPLPCPRVLALGCAAGRPYATDGSGLHAVNWRDFEDLTDFLGVHLQWLAGHELAPTAAEALASAAARVRSVVDPQRRSSVGIGHCPVMITAEGEVRPFACATPVRVKLGNRSARCKGCGTVDTVEGWLARMVGKPQLVTTDELRKLLHQRLGVRISAIGVRSWVHRGLIGPAGRDDQGRSVFDFREVVRALMAREQLQLQDDVDAIDVETGWSALPKLEP